MATIIATLSNGTLFEFPEENMSNVRRMLGHQIVSFDYKTEPEEADYSEVVEEKSEEVKTSKRGRKKVTN
jgi:hypothetical protein